MLDFLINIEPFRYPIENEYLYRLMAILYLFPFLCHNLVNA